jgi:hypothetical protein
MERSMLIIHHVYLKNNCIGENTQMYVQDFYYHLQKKPGEVAKEEQKKSE